MSDVSTELTIESAAYGGKGVGRSDGKVWFVKDAVPGDQVIAEVVSEHRRYVEGKVQSFVKKSPLRQPSPCRYSDDCGGCQWLEVPYEEQLQWKRSFVHSALTRIGRLEKTDSIPISGSPSHLHYRNRILLRVYGTGSGLEVGYFRSGSRELVKIDRCQIADPLLNDLMSQLQSFSGPQGSKWRLECQVVGTTERQIAVTVYPGDKDTPGSQEIVDDLNKLSIVAWAGLVFQLADAPLLKLEEDLDLVFHTLPGQFQQINTALNHKLRRIVSKLVRPYSPKRVLDVCCGSGNLSLPLAKEWAYVEAVEANKKAIAVGHSNAEKNKLNNIQFIAGDAEGHLWKCAKKRETFDVVILDPPREGMYQGMIPLKEIAPRAIVYVSCDPNTLARDIGALTKKDRYRLAHVEAIDFFPNTYHVETVAVLERQPREKGPS